MVYPLSGAVCGGSVFGETSRGCIVAAQLDGVDGWAIGGDESKEASGETEAVADVVRGQGCSVLVALCCARTFAGGRTRGSATTSWLILARGVAWGKG